MTWNDLDEHLADIDDQVYDQPPADPGDTEGVNRALRRLARYRRARQAAVDAAATEIQRIVDWRDERVDKIDRRIRWELDGLELYHRARLGDDPTAKTLHFPCGTLHARKTQPAFDYDETTFLPWAQEHAPDLVRLKPQVDRTAAKTALVAPDLGEGDTGPALTPDGEIVPGVTVTVRGPSFTITTEEQA